MIFNKDIKKWMNLSEANDWSYDAETRPGTGMKLVFKVREKGPDEWEITAEDPKGEVVNSYKGSFQEVHKKLLQFKIQSEKTTRTKEK